jgi:hypothetical protein
MTCQPQAILHNDQHAHFLASRAKWQKQSFVRHAATPLPIVLWEIMSWDRSLWGRLAGSNVYCAGTDPGLVSKGWAPRTKGSPLIYPCKQVTEARSKKQSSTHIWLHVTSLAISFLQCYVTFMFQFFKFYLYFAIPSPCLIVRTQSVSFLAFPFLLQ